MTCPCPPDPQLGHHRPRVKAKACLLSPFLHRAVGFCWTSTPRTVTWLAASTCALCWGPSSWYTEVNATCILAPAHLERKPQTPTFLHLLSNTNKREHFVVTFCTKPGTPSSLGFRINYCVTGTTPQNLMTSLSGPSFWKNFPLKTNIFNGDHSLKIKRIWLWRGHVRPGLRDGKWSHLEIKWLYSMVFQ